ncbi:MAG: hypothetical protein E7527_04185 [Ruminococcaceae bacterium]|nr:hypothetical protein [Oscillospiraceae bacterium]
MNFWIGLLLGVGLSLAVRGVLAEFAPESGVEKPDAPPQPSDRTHWAQTRNFLYYDGTVMPEIKEDAHEH